MLERARWRARWRLEAAEDASRGRARCVRVRPGWTHPDGGRRVECKCMRVSCASPARARVSVACTCTCTCCYCCCTCVYSVQTTVRRLRGREPRLTFSVGRELAVCGLSLRATVECVLELSIFRTLDIRSRRIHRVLTVTQARTTIMTRPLTAPNQRLNAQSTTHSALASAHAMHKRSG